MDKIILRTTLLTFFAVFTAFAYGTAVFGLILPRAMAELCDNMGAHNGSAMYYERIYNNDKTGANLYNALNKFILAKNHEKVIKYSQKFFSHDEYAETIEKVNKAGRQAANNKYDYISWSNEDNRIKCAYMMSLIEKGKIEKACTKLTGWLGVRPINSVERERPNHAFFALVVTDNVTAKTLQAFKDYYDAFAEGFSGTSLHALDFLMIGGQYLGKNITGYLEAFNEL